MITPAAATSPIAPSPARVSLPTAPASVPTQTDLVTLSGTSKSSDARRQMFRKLEWAGFGTEMIGGTLTLVGHPAVGLPLAAAGAVLMVYAGYQRKHA